MMRHLHHILSGEHCMWGLPTRDAYVYFLAAFGMVLGLGYSLYLGDVTRFGDEQVYLDLGRNLSEFSIYSKDGLHLTSERPPGYPFFLSAVFSLGGDIFAIRISQVAFFSMSLIILHRILVQWDFGSAGPIAATLTFCYPALLYTTATIYPQSLTTFLFLLATYLGIAKRINWGRFLSCGFVFGLLAITTPIFLVTLPCFLLAPWILDHRRKFLPALLFLFTTIALLTPWSVRNYDVFDRFILISSNSGLNLILGNSDFAEPNIGTLTDIKKYRVVAAANSTNTAEYDASLRTQAVEWIRDNKSAAAVLYLKKFLNYFNYRNQLASESQESSLKNAVMFLTYYPLLFLAISQILFGNRHKSRLLEIYMATCYLLLALFYAVFFTRIRFRLPLDWFLICFSALYLSELVQRIAIKSKS